MKDNQTIPEPEQIKLALQTDGQAALADLFEIAKPRLKRIVHFRLDYRLGGRVSESDVIQEVYLRAADRMERFLDNDDMPFFVWLRLETNQRLQEIHRHHFAAEKRDVRREIKSQPVDEGQTSMALAAHLVAQMTSPSRLVERAEQISMLETSLNGMDELDREVIAPRHFEELSNIETAAVLGIETSAASKRYLRALKRLKEIMQSFHSQD